jgi:hypothetical protein
MLDRLILGVVLSVVGCNGLFSEPTPPVEKTLKQKAKERQQSEICLRKTTNIKVIQSNVCANDGRSNKVLEAIRTFFGKIAWGTR